MLNLSSIAEAVVVSNIFPHCEGIKFAGFFKPVCIHELHNLVPGYFGIELPVEVAHEFNPLNPRHPHEIFNSFLRFLLVFPCKEHLQELFVFFRKSGHISKQSEVFPQVR